MTWNTLITLKILIIVSHQIQMASSIEHPTKPIRSLSVVQVMKYSISSGNQLQGGPCMFRLLCCKIQQDIRQYMLRLKRLYMNSFTLKKASMKKLQYFFLLGESLNIQSCQLLSLYQQLLRRATQLRMKGCDVLFPRLLGAGRTKK